MATRIFLALGIFSCLVLSVSVPLLTYSVGLVSFGLMHVVRELHYVDHRFGARLPRAFALGIAMLLVSIAMLRMATVFGMAPPLITFRLELGLVFLLALMPQLFMTHASRTARASSLVIALLIGIGFFLSPMATVVILAVLHNLTPVGFIVEATKGEHKKFVLVVLVFIFVAIPMLIASGAFHSLLSFVPHDDNLTILPTGPLDKHLGVFVPEQFRYAPWATHAFSAVVFAQCLHYIAVIYVMPKILQASGASIDALPVASWPHARALWGIIFVATAMLVIMYANNFFFARSFYGIAAALHAYIEIPLLMWALSTSMAPAKGVELEPLFDDHHVRSS